MKKTSVVLPVQHPQAERSLLLDREQASAQVIRRRQNFGIISGVLVIAAIMMIALHSNVNSKETASEENRAQGDWKSETNGPFSPPVPEPGPNWEKTYIVEEEATCSKPSQFPVWSSGKLFCVDCHTESAIVLEAGQEPRCVTNTQGGACLNIVWDEGQAQCFDQCPLAVANANGHPKCVLNEFDAPCTHIYYDKDEPVCMDTCPNQQSVVSYKNQVQCMVDQNGSACTHIYFESDGRPVCMDDCPSQQAVVYIQGAATCLRNMAGGACQHIEYSQGWNNPKCLDGSITAGTDHFSVAFQVRDESTPVPSVPTPAPVEPTTAPAAVPPPEATPAPEAPAPAPAPVEPTTAPAEVPPPVATPSPEAPAPAPAPVEPTTAPEPAPVEPTTAPAEVSPPEVTTSPAPVSVEPTSAPTEPAAASHTSAVTVAPTLACSGKYDILEVTASGSTDCIHCTKEAYVSMNQVPSCVMNSNGAPCSHVLWDMGTPKCFDDCPDQKSVVYDFGHPVCVLNEQGGACVHILRVFGKPECFDYCPDPKAVVFTLGLPQCVLNSAGGACRNIVHEFWGYGPPLCADECVKVTYTWGIAPTCIHTDGSRTQLKPILD